ncbi:MAG: Na(+)/H(+) antiporter NhaA [Acidimicrobiales bacterium]|nr:MAG: Na(+)/H(+) antiporter NhaA [Acidimicrobiales bacterium]
MEHEAGIRTRDEAWSGGESRLAQSVARPLIRFLAQSTSSGVVLIVATVAALVWANSPWDASYISFWESEIDLRLGDWQPFVSHDHPLTVRDWVNDGLMVLFFFVVGMQITAELLVGELRNPRAAALPAVAALGGMVAPALIYFAINAGEASADGWGVPMATDIAFAVGVLALLGDRVPSSLKVFLLMLAIVDDIGAILVIAVFYTDQLATGWLLLSFVGLGLMGALRSARVWYTPVYLVVGFVVWFAMLRSGVHATIAGVAIGLLTPVRPLLGHRRLEIVEDVLSGDRVEPAEMRDASWKLRESVSVAGRLTALLSPWTVFIVVPLFAIANAGIPLSGSVLSDAASSPATIGVVAGLVLGKPLGIGLAAWIARSTGLASLPAGVTMRHIVGTGFVAGIGFTVALFISGLAFDDARVADEAVIGVLVASILSAVIGAALLGRTPRADGPT